jgi:hypothetical protein
MLFDCAEGVRVDRAEKIDASAYSSINRAMPAFMAKSAARVRMYCIDAKGRLEFLLGHLVLPVLGPSHLT